MGRSTCIISSKWRLLAFALFFIFANSTSIFTQVSGVILDSETDEPLVGVTVLLLGTNTGATTDEEGKFSLPANEGDIIVCSFIGYTRKEIVLDTSTNLSISLVSGLLMEEVVVTGYSVDVRRKIPGSASTVRARDVQIAPSGNIEQQLQGRVAGVNVITNGQPGTTSQVRIRGYGALGGNEPLYIVDGVPVGSVDFLSPGDIASVTVLKDATAASIYGARAAGGVIVYTTTKGQRGQQKMKISYDGMFGVTSPGAGLSVMNPQDQADWTWAAIQNAAISRGEIPEFAHPQYGNGAKPVLPDYLLVGSNAGVVGAVDLEAQREFYNIDLDAGPIYQVVKANKEGTNWYDAVMRDALLQRHHLGISGSGASSRYYVGVGMQDQQGIVRNQQFSRYSFRVNTEFDLLPSLRIGENFQGTYRSTRLLEGEAGGIGSADSWTFVNSSLTNPIIPVYDEFGGYAGNAATGVGINWSNPVADAENLKDDRNFAVQTFGNFYLELEPIKGLIFRSSFGGQFSSANSRNYMKTTYHRINNRTIPAFSQFSSYTAQWVWTNTASFRRNIGYHNLDLLVGQEVLDQGSGFTISGSGLDPFSENIDYIGLSTLSSRTVEGAPFKGVRFASYFTRINYDFADKYLVSMVLRRDGSSRFGQKNRFGFFPAFSAAWRISSENFLRKFTFIDDLKLRGGFGVMGNSNNVDPNNQYSLFSTSLDASSYDINGTNTSAVEGFYRTRIGNPAAKWEQAITANIGLDMLLFNGKIDIGVEWWRKRTKDLLFRMPVTVQSGFFAADPFVNVGEMLNEGLDFTLTNRGRFNQIKYQITVNGGFLHNEIVALAPDIDNLPDRSSTYGGIRPILNQVGQPLSAFYGFEVLGLFQDQAEVDAAPIQEGAAPGRFRYRDINEDGVINQEDRTNLGNPIADFTGGLALKLGFRNLELEMYSFASIGNEIFNLSKRFSDFYSAGAAIAERVQGSWSFENPRGSIPIFENVSNFSTNTQSNSYYVEDGSYFRMQNITLSYLIPQAMLSRWNLEKFRLYVSVNNAFTITGYSGLDPSVGGSRDTNFGVDRGNYPITRNWIFGINLDF
ncbi:MAG: SusC/RagA family TonB-linked outer membrane protein [Saprospiraceae bacterium]|nr:SusC/RagA family TonB-linked outer membrane protein [Saprospiraceae bacterium]